MPRVSCVPPLGIVLFTVAVLASPPATAAATAETAPADSSEAGPHFGRAALEVLGTNLTVWSFDRFVREGGENPEFRVSFRSVWDNVKNGFEWDNNNLSTNNFQHPYHGSLYFNAARSNGFNYWESMGFAFGGSFLWEYTGEVNNPAYNDWINTSVGGAAMGETLYRLSDLVLDDTARGGERFWRETAGFLINPMRGVNRLISGESGRVGLNPPGRRPDQLGTVVEVGWRSQSRQRVGVADTSGAFLALDFIYGDPYQDDGIQPFDSFEFHAQVNLNDVSKVGRIQSFGLLAGRHPDSDGEHRSVQAIYQAFEYIENRGFTFGGQTLGAALLRRFGDGGSNWGLHGELGAGLLLLAGTSAEVENFSGREYDYGSGLSYHLGLGLRKRGWTLADLALEGHWLRTFNGNPGSHFVSLTTLKMMLPLHDHLGVGADLRGHYRHTSYREFGKFSHWLPEVRVFGVMSTF